MELKDLCHKFYVLIYTSVNRTLMELKEIARDWQEDFYNLLIVP